MYVEKEAYAFAVSDANRGSLPVGYFVPSVNSCCALACASGVARQPGMHDGMSCPERTTPVVTSLRTGGRPSVLPLPSLPMGWVSRSQVPPG